MKRKRIPVDATTRAVEDLGNAVLELRSLRGQALSMMYGERRKTSLRFRELNGKMSVVKVKGWNDAAFLAFILVIATSENAIESAHRHMARAIAHDKRQTRRKPAVLRKRATRAGRK